MKLIKGTEKLIYIFKCFYLYQTYIIIHKSSLLFSLGITNKYFIFSSILVSISSIFFTRNLGLRILVFIANFFFFLELFKLEYATHAWHFIIYISFFLIFINNSSSGRKLKDLFSFWSIQFMILFTYSLSGFYKFAASFFTSGNNLGYFSFEGVSNLIAYRVLENTQPLSELTKFFIEHKFISFTLGLLAVFIELFSLLAFFHPKLIKAWGLLLISVHLFALIVMDINFEANMFCCLLFLVMSPLKNLNFPYRLLSLQLLPSRTLPSK